ncbi:kinesin-like protein bimC [Exophiala spinifera]|uniref:Kinesin-like protein bimC n=1 Tax=Exophiala spinifera TaxID=91928 RepID=A0A0D1ZLU7_9EURO|nr:kinesin-like protein bimC [Exophiala spinifera]KIW13817.1 kinesin-like protein bimC [Exophiala spinifera]
MEQKPTYSSSAPAKSSIIEYYTSERAKADLGKAIGRDLPPKVDFSSYKASKEERTSLQKSSSRGLSAKGVTSQSNDPQNFAGEISDEETAARSDTKKLLRDYASSFKTTPVAREVGDRYGGSLHKDASSGIKLVQRGSHRGEVAASKCNDFSSRSHTIFTITTYIKKVNDPGEDCISSGKLNLVDVAGSENIQRSGTENKRATEVGLINKSLLTTGRVINALVDKRSHIPIENLS